jgi:hypothetical protein
MIRSVLRISDEDFKKIRKSMPTKTKKQLEVKSKFNINPKERAMLEELADVLTHFEWLTDNLQTNEVSISRVYPCIVSLRIKLNKDIDCMKYTKNLRKDLIASLDKRFGNLIENDLFLVSTYLDPFFGPKSFPLDKRNYVKLRLKYHLGLLCPNSTNNNSFDTVAIETNNRSSNFVFHDVESSTINTFDDMDALIKHYSDHVTSKTYENPLLFWKCHKKQFPE